MSLVKAERRRLFKRRFTRYLLLLVLLVLAGVAVGTFVTNQKIGPEQVAAAQREVDRMYQQNLQTLKEGCEQAKAAGTNSDLPTDCSQIVPPPGFEPETQWYLPATFVFRTDFEQTIYVLAGVLALFAFLVGASYVGAEWQTGGMMNLLLWRPRRLAVLLTKLGTLLAALLGIFVGLAAAWTATFWGIATLRGDTDRMTSGVWQSFALTGLRGLGLVMVAGVIGFGLASIGRHTALALGAVVGAGVVGFVGVRVALSLIEVRFVERWLWPSYLAAWMDKTVTLQDGSSCRDFSLGGCRPREFVITWQQSGLLFAAGTLAVLVVALWTMRRRDIT
jgi:hypothetical protein